MGKNIINRFGKGPWLSWSNSLLGNRSRLSALLSLLPRYARKGGLSSVKKDLRLLGLYINDIIHGRYREYDTSSLSLAVAAIVYTISPLDLTPDFVPLGLLDDATIVTWAIAQLSSELERYQKYCIGRMTTTESSATPES